MIVLGYLLAAWAALLAAFAFYLGWSLVRDRHTLTTEESRAGHAFAIFIVLAALLLTGVATWLIY